MTTTKLPTSPRLTFRCWRDDDEALAKKLWADPDVTKLITSEPIDIRARLQAEIQMQTEHGIQYWPMFAADGDFVGAAGLRPRDPDARIYELGFHLCSHTWGKGFATESARAVITFAFHTLDATALFAGHNPENKASARVLQKLGFKHTHDELYPPTGLLHPSYVLAR